jgi:CYTH domain-containing protein
LRLRRTENARGVVVYKLGQKVRLEPGNPETVRLTNMYLSAEEYEALLALPAAEVQKERWTSTWAERQIAVDRFFGRLDGLVLAEVELEPSEAYAPSPPYATRDVTQDDRFSGGALAFASDIEIDLLLKDLTTAGRDVKPPPTSDYRGDHRL